MSQAPDDSQDPNPQDPDPQKEPGDGHASLHQQQVQHSRVSARVPERVRQGVFSTGAIVLQGTHEFVIDFILRLAGAPQVAARVILPPSVMASLIAAMQENLGKYQQSFGPPPPLPQPPPSENPPSINDIYDDLKMPDEQLSGVYANTVMIGHTPSEFWFDFITSFFPRSSVSCRVYLTAAQAPRFLETLKQAFKKSQPPPPGEAK